MQDSVLISTGLPIALAIIMFGLGLSLTPGDFARVARTPRAVIGILAVQILVLPVIAFGLVLVFDLPPLLAVGVMLLAASPGGTTTNLFSHLFRGDVALNISLTAINSVLAAFTIPLITNLAIGHFDADGALGLQFTKVVQVIALVLAPVAIGMVVRSRWSGFARSADRPVRIFSIAVLVVVTTGAIIAERDNVVDYARQVGVVVSLFCLISLSCGFGAALLLRLTRPQAVAASMEIGVHNTTIALTIALSVLDNAMVAVPAAVYSIVMYILTPAFGWVITREPRTATADDDAVGLRES
ncbi:bile acid:sodium symporter family protein [Gordonia sp. NB41Y]|uniref:bile acid:sodium symporter family protein n=1 Tax=Gordonia sp. NB41Y TaxID=875808 RepID=UPI0006B1F127|nr:bile acid:sodium symporter family protein [Gordonia sp. NB41Y]EMP14693.2 bile acid:sodium symporter [Gordonia sp. NB41Y]WLP89093.1 bile acid:sodium symporter family protein [Gordonia sp. NB41Y]